MGIYFWEGNAIRLGIISLLVILIPTNDAVLLAWGLDGNGIEQEES